MHDVLVPHKAVFDRVSHVRSTLLQSSLANLKRCGYLEQWRTHIDPRIGRDLEELIAPTWVDVELAIAHYQACDALNLGATQIDLMGQNVGDQLQAVLVGLAARTARAAGIDPKLAVLAFEKLFGRVFQGGSISVIQTGPKDVLVEMKLVQLSMSYYWRTAYLGHLRAAAKFIGARAVYTKTLRFDAVSDTFLVSMAYV